MKGKIAKLTSIASLLAVIVLFGFRKIEADRAAFAAVEQREEVEKVFDVYSTSLVRRDIDSAYAFGSQGFKDATSMETFQAIFKDLEGKNGILKSVDSVRVQVHGRSSPIGWVAHVEALFHYEKSSVTIVHELHREDGKWVLYGFKTY